MISVLDYGVGNLGSVINMFRKIGVPAKLVTTADEVQVAEKLLLPGVGAFDHAMVALADSGMMEPMKRRVIEGRVKILGICLGMQLLGEGSAEGKLPGLGFVNAVSIKIESDGDRRIRVPHMGWNEVKIEKQTDFVSGLDDESRFYFVHSYHLVCKNTDDVLATVEHGGRLTAMIEKDNVFGAQFHPEKSHKFGMRLFKNFSEI